MEHRSVYQLQLHERVFSTLWCIVTAVLQDFHRSGPLCVCNQELSPNDPLSKLHGLHGIIQFNLLYAAAGSQNCSLGSVVFGVE